MSRHAIIAIVFASALLTGCDMVTSALGIESPEKVAAAREADGKAVGGACRHAGRAIEDCYTMNKKAEKASVFAGWRDMNDYMRENKIEPVPPQLAAQVKPATETR
jgi:biotin carboxylase